MILQFHVEKTEYFFLDGRMRRVSRSRYTDIDGSIVRETLLVPLDTDTVNLSTTGAMECSRKRLRVHRYEDSISWLICLNEVDEETVLTFNKDSGIFMSGAILPFKRIRQIHLSEKDQVIMALSGIPSYHLKLVPFFKEITLLLQDSTYV